METPSYEQKRQRLSSDNLSETDSVDSNDDRICGLFKKSFTIVENGNYELPEPDDMFIAKPWQNQKLQIMKEQLNDTKNRLNDYILTDWQSHTKRRNKAGHVLPLIRKRIKPEFVTQAWCKFYEIVQSFPLVPINEIRKRNMEFNSVHLCEAPGAFITSLNHWLKTNAPAINWGWTATTLNPYYEGNEVSNMIDDDRVIRNTLSNWCFGADNTGNLMDLKNLYNLVSVVHSKGEVLLVTADGSIDCIEKPDEQEEIVSHLHLCEVVAMMHILAKGGSFLIKIFTTFEHQLVCLLYLLSCSFATVVRTKPATSKEGNSETYVVCLGFKGPEFIAPYLTVLTRHYEQFANNAMFRIDDIPVHFLTKIIECSEFFKSEQCKVILSNIITFSTDGNDTILHEEVLQIKRKVAQMYIQHYDLRPLDSKYFIFQDFKLKIPCCPGLNSSREAVNISFNDRCKRKSLGLYERLEQQQNELENIVIQLSTNTVFKCIQRSRPVSIDICSGKAFRKVNSSRFCEKQVLQVKNTVADLVKKLKLDVHFPTSAQNRKIIDKIEQENEGYKCLSFTYTNVYNSHRIISQIYNSIKDLTHTESLVIVGYCLLTQVSVGLLYLLRHTFDELRLTLDDTVGCLITLKNFTKNDSILAYFDEINNAALVAQKEGKVIVSVVRISDLYDSKFYDKIVDSNHWNIKSYVNTVISLAENR